MPICENREYRAMPIMAKAEDSKEYNVQGYASTFNEPYLLFEDGDERFYEQIDSRAFDNADMTDVLFQYNHKGRVFARTKMKQGKEPTLTLTVDEHGLLVNADLSTTTESRSIFEDIDSGLIYQMSFAFIVAEDTVEKLDDDSYLRTIKSFRKIFDVSCVDIPANPNTDIASRSFEGFIEEERKEFARQKAIEEQKQRIRILAEL